VATTPAKAAAPKAAEPAKSAAATTFAERAQISNAPAWMPKEGDILTGEVVGVRIGSTGDYDDYPVMVLKTDDGYKAFHVFHGVARERLSELKPTKGDSLTVQYLGQREANKPIVRNGKEEPNIYHAYYMEKAGVETTAGLLEDYAW
jgi:hypothetical protein